MRDEQKEAIAFIEHHARRFGGAPQSMSTHISRIFLAGDRAFKLKRAVRFAYVDFSTAERRLAACEAELALNRRTAPDLYLGVRRLTRARDGGLEFGGEGALVDAVIEMRRFDQEALFDNMARRGALTPRIMTDLAQAIARFHRNAPVSHGHGGAAGMRAVLDLNEQAFRAVDLFARDSVESLSQRFRDALASHATLLDARQAQGKVRRCHGDLILRNICLIDGHPVMFDCIEFDEGLATIDVLYDLAFLLMDLWARDQRGFANLVLNRYLDVADETNGLALVPFFMAMRAAVRAHVGAAQVAGLSGAAADEARREALHYFDLANQFLSPAPPLCVALGGFSGSGKSTTAALLSPELGAAPGARTLNSDRIRKSLHGVTPETRLPQSAYAPEVSSKIYGRLRSEAARVLAAGWSVVADAVFDREDERVAMEQAAEAARVPFQGFWLAAPAEVLASRIEARRNDPSDATREVLAAQTAREIGRLDWARIDAGADAQTTADAIARRLNSTE